MCAHQSPILQVETKFSIISAFVERWKKTQLGEDHDEKRYLILVGCLMSMPNLEISVHPHVNQLVSDTGKSAMNSLFTTRIILTA